MLVIALFTLFAGAGAIAVASLAAGCSDSGCMMGSGCTMGKMGAAGNNVEKSGTTIVNARCPIMGGKPVTALTRDYNGQKVGFCCGGCPAQWDKLTDAEKNVKLAKAMAASQ
jgi:hypothetical protein